MEKNNHMEEVNKQSNSVIYSNKQAKSILPIYDISEISYEEFPNHISSVISFSGCNMHCGYCYNPSEVRKGKGGKISKNDVMSFLETSIGNIDAVVFSGGEPTIYKDIISFSKGIKDMGFSIKLDTNGTRPEVIKKMVNENLIDFISLDYKSPPSKYKNLTNNKDWSRFDETLNFLINNRPVDFEVITTVHTDLINEEDIQYIVDDLDCRGYQEKYFLQNFISPLLKNKESMQTQDYDLDINSINFPTNFVTEYRGFADI